jgi:hypothetical protein
LILNNILKWNLSMPKCWKNRPQGSNWDEFGDDDQHGRMNYITANQRSSFLLTAPPLRMPGAAGSPVTPVATV